MNKKLIIGAVAIMTAIACQPAVAGSYQSANAKQEMCTMHGKLAMLFASAKKKGEKPPIDIETLKDDGFMYEMARGFARVGEEQYLDDPVVVGRSAFAWCMDNIESVHYRHSK